MKALMPSVLEKPYRIAILCLWSLFAAPALCMPAATRATVRLTRATLTFSSQGVATSSPSQPITLSNIGTAPLVIAKLTASGDFSESNNCDGELAVSTSCTINITFRPAARGLRKGTLTILDNATGSPHVIRLLGVGTQVKLSVDTLSFEGQPVHNPSHPKVVTLTNIGSTPLRIAAIRITPAVSMWGAPLGSSVSSSRRADEFTETNGCGTSLAQRASCTISVTFTPRRAGSSTAWLVVSDDGGGSPQRVTLWGVGLR